jgi:hypothetical protein
MNRRLGLTVGFCALLCARVASAQVGSAAGGDAAIGYMGLPQKAAAEAPNGIQIADGVIMHVGAGAESGYDTNVFYQDKSSTNYLGSGILRATGFAQIGNASRTGQVPAGMAFTAGAGLQYRRYLSDDPALSGYKNAFMPTAHLSLGVSSGQFGFSFLDSFVRMEDTPYTPGQESFVRDSNTASVEGRWAPGGGRLSSTLRYTNILDIYEDQSLKLSSSVGHQLLLDVSWKWLPKTALFVQASQGYITYLYDASTKIPSYPLRAFAGLRGLVTPRIAALLALGYVNGFYSTGTNTGGFLGSSYLQAQAMMTPTLVSRIVLGYKHDFSNSVVSSFTYDDTVYLSYAHQIAGRVAASLSGRYIRRNFQGNVVGLMAGEERIDNLFTVGGSVDYYPRNWIYLGVGYALFANSSSATLTTPDGPQSLDYVKQQIFARLGVTY